ncbi:MAG: mucoidy inhibitor MuiA family protein [Ktedonobacteraceae bacterium]|nr:mucoidy inhibitor MuiA family protein [Ktedonobacteraceae bacterium]
MIDLVAPIKEVTVYSDRALITRCGSIHLPAGEHKLRVNTLTDFLRDSLRAAAYGPRGTRILDVDVTTAFHSHSPEPETLQLQTELAALQRDYHLLEVRQEALNDRRKWLRALGDRSREFARGLAQGQMKPQDCADFFRFMTQQALQDAQAAQDLEVQLHQVKQDIEMKQRQLAHKGGDFPSDRLAAIITVELAEAGVFALDLSYLALDSSWYPQYDVRVQMNAGQSEGQVELSYVSIVRQYTGEPWQQVALSLSTARPSLAAVLPELDPWYINVYTPPSPTAAASFNQASTIRTASRARTRQLSEGQEENYAPVAATLAPASVATTTSEQTGTALVFRAGRSVDIPSDNSPHKNIIALDSLPCTFDYVSAPALEEHTHLRATITNITERVLLHGEASIFLGGEYVGTTQIETTAPTEKFKVFLGLDDGVKVKRELIERAVDKGVLLQSDLRRITYAYRITVHNYTASLKQVIIRDHLPVSQHERARVKVQSIQPQPTERTKLELLTWQFTLAADEEQRIEYRFLVEHPQDLRLVGLP